MTSIFNRYSTCQNMFALLFPKVLYSSEKITTFLMSTISWDCLFNREYFGWSRAHLVLYLGKLLDLVEDLGGHQEHRALVVRSKRHYSKQYKIKFGFMSMNFSFLVSERRRVHTIYYKCSAYIIDVYIKQYMRKLLEIKSERQDYFRLHYILSIKAQKEPKCLCMTCN